MTDQDCYDTSERVSRHYNAIIEEDHTLRRQSVIYGLRKFNNWIKTVQIHDAVSRVKSNFGTIKDLLVMDMCCGKGGDVEKWRQIGASRYIGVDIADSSIKDARNRQLEHKKTRQSNSAFKAQFQCMDCFKTSITPSLFSWIEESSGCHIVSCMFSLHYAFEDRETASRALSNISNILLPKGVFIATIPHEETLEEKRKNSHSFGNSVYKIEFMQNDNNTGFSKMYRFTLSDRVIDCPEYTVPMMTLYKLAKEVNLKLLYYASFPDFYEEHRENPEHNDLLYRFGVLDRGEETDQDHPKSVKFDEWEVIQLYAVAAFQKI